MLNELIQQAIKIESETDATIGGAIVQVCESLTMDDIKEIFIEAAGKNERKLQRYMKKIARTESGDKFFTIHILQQDVENIIISRIASMQR